MTAPALPHEQVYVRLSASHIHGIGVLAICDIPAGTNVFANDRVEIVWVDRSRLAHLSAEQAQLYHDFGIASGEQIGCPVNFNNLTPGWYCNEPAKSAEANITVDREFNFVALRDIAQGEELTVRYAEFSVAD